MLGQEGADALLEHLVSNNSLLSCTLFPFFCRVGFPGQAFSMAQIWCFTNSILPLYTPHFASS
jgi:hypothetical protein